jgi:hypothetical protein
VSPPAGTVVILHQGMVITPLLHWTRTLPASVKLLTVEGHQIARQRNMGVDGSVGDWVLFLDSDSVPRTDTLSQLLATGASLVSAVVLERRPPYRLPAIKSLEPETRWTLDEIPRTGLLDVYATGAGCLLVRKTVFDAVKAPWFRCGQLIPDLLLEDTEFTIRAGEAGFPPQLACAVRIGHKIGGGTVWPGVDGFPWLHLDGPGDYWVPLGKSGTPAERLPERV